MPKVGNPPPQNLDFHEYVKGDTLAMFNIPGMTFNGFPPPHALVSCKMVFVDSTARHFFKFSTTPRAGEGRIVINNAATWDVSVEPIKLNLPEGEYTWDWSFTDSTGWTETYLRGTLPITLGRANGYY